MKLSLKLLIDDRDRAFHRGQRTKYKRIKKEAHIFHLEESLLNKAVHSDNPKRLWKSLRTLSRCGKPSVSHAFSSDEFCQFFTSHFEPSDPSVFITDDDASVAPPIVISDVLYQLRRLSKSSVGPDGIPPWIFKKFADLVAPAVSCGTVLFA